MKFVAYSEEKIVGMTIFRDELIVATEGGVWRLVNGKFIPIQFQSKVPEYAEAE